MSWKYRLSNLGGWPEGEGAAPSPSALRCPFSPQHHPETPPISDQSRPDLQATLRGVARVSGTPNRVGIGRRGFVERLLSTRPAPMSPKPKRIRRRVSSPPTPLSRKTFKAMYAKPNPAKKIPTTTFAARHSHVASGLIALVHLRPSGLPHCGHALALLLTSCPHSGQGSSAIAPIPRRCDAGFCSLRARRCFDWSADAGDALAVIVSSATDSRLP